MSPSVAIIGTRGYPSFYGGFETAVRRLAPYLAEHGWDVTVYGRPGATVDDLPDRDPRVRTKVTRGLEQKSLSTLSFGATAAIDARRDRPDVALVMNVANGPFLPLLERAGIPTVVNVDGIEWEREKWGRLAKAVFRHGARQTAKHATSLVFDAHEIGRRWREGFGRDGWYIPYGGTPHDGPVPEGLTSGGYALVVARFVPENSVPEFFDAVERIADRLDVVIVGSSGYGGELDERAAALQAAHGRVRWLGHVKDDQLLHSLWQHAGAYFHGHSVGGTNPALVQAMACGAPVVARDTPYNREVLEDAGVLVAPEPQAIADALVRVAGDEALRGRMRAEGMRRAQETFTWEAVCGAYEEALRAAIDGRAPRG